MQSTPSSEIAFPRASAVWPGCILGGIVNAVMTAENTGYSSFCGWNEMDYWMNGGDGRYGVITFDAGHLVGTFCNVKSPRTPFHRGESFNLDEFFRGCPPFQRALAEMRTLKYWHQEGHEGPFITSAFWDDRDCLTAADSTWDIVLEHGADLAETEVMGDVPTAWANWKEGYQMSEQQIALAQAIFSRKVNSAAVPLVLPPAEVAMLKTWCADVAALKVCREVFSCMGIILPA